MSVTAPPAAPIDGGSEPPPPNTSSHNVPPKLKFGRSEGFQRALKQRVDEYFTSNKVGMRDVPSMYLKTFTILVWMAASYVGLVFFATSLWVAIPLAMSLALAVAACGFNIQHDGGHKGYSENKIVNRVMAFGLDLIGGSSYVWNFKHNAMHHIYANIHGYDDDLNIGPLARLSPHQDRYAAHRFQHFYLWFLYGFAAMKWHFWDDFFNVAAGHLAGHPFKRPTGLEFVFFFGGKLVFYSWALIIPMFFHPITTVIGFYVLTSMMVGVVISVIFQLAHCVEEADFPLPDDQARIESEWMIHQLETTVDFSRGNPFLCWYLGGLNMQAIHHLFPQICHVHYPNISRIVEKTCLEYDVPYKAHRSLPAAVASHYRWLRRLGQPDAA
jgi:linoleoyl-CoA desaturase